MTPADIRKEDFLCSARLNSWGWSQQGKHRTENGDAFLNWPECRCWAVADGVAGSDYGEKASRLLMENLMQLPPAASLEQHISNVRSSLEESHSLLTSRSLWPGSAASTIVVLLMHERQAACLWSGDSRCYLLRNNVLYQCTHDHTLRQEKIDRGELTAPEACRMIKGNIITSAIGAPSARIDEVRFTLRGGDRLLLCSDGLTTTLGPARLKALLKQGNARACAERIREALADYPPPDDTTLIAIVLS